MRLVVLLSFGRHPVSGKAVLPRAEALAIRMAAELGEPQGLHAGPDALPAEAAFGRGVDQAVHLHCAAETDPVDALAQRLADIAPDVVFAGRRSQGGDETGLVPYAVAARLGTPIVADVVAARAGNEPGLLIVDQALPKGALRRLTVRTPVVLTVHPNAPEPLPFAFGRARGGRLERIEADVPAVDVARPSVEERPYRKRPKMMRAAPAGGSAADRLKAVSGEANAGGAQIMDHPTPEEAAREVLSFLRRAGVLAPAASSVGPDRASA